MRYKKYKLRRMSKTLVGRVIMRSNQLIKLIKCYLFYPYHWQHYLLSSRNYQIPNRAIQYRVSSFNSAGQAHEPKHTHIFIVGSDAIFCLWNQNISCVNYLFTFFKISYRWNIYNPKIVSMLLVEGGLAPHSNATVNFL